MSIRITQNNCVGCGRCIEACPGNLIKKDAHMGGAGSTLSVKSKGNIREWCVTSPDGSVQVIEVNKKDANKY